MFACVRERRKKKKSVWVQPCVFCSCVFTRVFRGSCIDALLRLGAERRPSHSLDLQQERAKMENDARARRLPYASAVSCRCMDMEGKPQRSKKNEPQINNIGRETIKESDRAARIREGYAARIEERHIHPPVSKWSAHLKPIAQRTKIHTNGNQIKWQLKQREADPRACPCVCVCVRTRVGARIRVLGKLLLLILGGETWKCYQMGHLAESGFRWDKSSSKKKKARTERCSERTSKTPNTVQTVTQDEATIHRRILRYIESCAWRFYITYWIQDVAINWNASLKKTDFHTSYGSIICVTLNFNVHMDISYHVQSVVYLMLRQWLGLSKHSDCVLTEGTAPHIRNWT